MKKRHVGLSIAACVCIAGSFIAENAHAVAPAPTTTITYNGSVTPINGTGNSDTGWTVVNNSGLNLQLDFMAQYNFPGYPGSPSATATPNNGAGTYLFSTGAEPGHPTKSIWNYWIGVNSDPNGAGGRNLLNVYDFYFTFSAPGGSFGTPVNFVTGLPDDAFGNNSTAAGGGTVANSPGNPNAMTLAGENNIAQNAENIGFSGLDPNTPGDYLFEVYAVAAGAGAAGTRVMELDDDVNVTPAPEPTTLALFGVGCLALVGKRLRQKNKH